VRKRKLPRVWVLWASCHQVGFRNQKKGRSISHDSEESCIERPVQPFNAEERKVAYGNSRPPDENATRLYRCWGTTGLCVHSSKDVGRNTKVHSCDGRKFLLFFGQH
jgi:hypothetical protein